MDFVPPKRQNKDVPKLKKCEFPGCETVEEMHYKAKYCQEHRKRKYRKVIDADKIKERKEATKIDDDSPNQIINHNFIEGTSVFLKCKACGEEFEVRMFPHLNIYPKYCPDHRNEFKRNRYLEERKK